MPIITNFGMPRSPLRGFLFFFLKKRIYLQLTVDNHWMKVHWIIIWETFHVLHSNVFMKKKKNKIRRKRDVVLASGWILREIWVVHLFSSKTHPRIIIRICPPQRTFNRWNVRFHALCFAWYPVHSIQHHVVLPTPSTSPRRVLPQWTTT